MQIQRDYSYIRENDKKLMDRGYGEMSLHSISFDRHYSEEQKKRNAETANSMTSEEWSKHCEEIARSFAPSMEEILSKFIGKYDIYQISEETSTSEYFNSDWDLYFYSDKGWGGRDYMTRFSLSFNDRRSPEQNMKLLEEIIPLVEAMDFKNIQCRIQYKIAIDEKKVKKDAETICESLVGKSIIHRGVNGKIKMIKESNGIREYGFFKKNAKSKYYAISQAELILMQRIESANQRRF